MKNEYRKQILETNFNQSRKFLFEKNFNIDASKVQISLTMYIECKHLGKFKLYTFSF